MDGVAGKVFSGRVHPVEIAGRLAREADFARFEHETGPATANVFAITVNPKDLTTDTTELERTLASEMASYAAQEGLRLEGPVEVNILPSDRVAGGVVEIHVEVRPGAPDPWARLVSNAMNTEIRHNRALVGRAPDIDVVIPSEAASRRHALIWRQNGKSWIKDLGSVNGTNVDGVPIDTAAVELHSGSVITIAGSNLRFMEL
jgi:hypothetical protein